MNTVIYSSQFEYNNEMFVGFKQFEEYTSQQITFNYFGNYGYGNSNKEFNWIDFEPFKIPSGFISEWFSFPTLPTVIQSHYEYQKTKDYKSTEDLFVGLVYENDPKGRISTIEVNSNFKQFSTPSVPDTEPLIVVTTYTLYILY